MAPQTYAEFGSAAALTKALDAAHSLHGDPKAFVGNMPELARSLDQARAILSTNHWESACADALEHPLAQVLHQDPFTRHAFERPRGYPGDAELLDYIYGFRRPTCHSMLGQAIFAYTTNVASSRAVRERSRHIASIIDSFASPSTSLAAIGAGHLREYEFSTVLKEATFGQLVVIDHDDRCLASICTSYPMLCASGKAHFNSATVLDLVRGRVRLPPLDLVYAVGLFDYLPDRTARKLCAKMLASLRAGGRLLIANFAPTLTDIGYMEAYMRWHLVYRTEADMLALAGSLSEEHVASASTTWDSQRCIVTLNVIRR